MKILSTDVKTAKNAQVLKPIFLYTLYAFDGTNNLNFASYDADVVFNGITYYKFPISHEQTSENSTGAIDQVKVKVSNVNRLMQSYLEIYNLKKKRLDITMVFADYLDNPANKITETFFIDSYTADQNAVELTLSSKLDILDVQIPARPFSRDYCSWKFKGTECGYTGGLTTCNRLKANCKERNNYLRFGGFPAIPQNRNYFQ